MHTLPVGNERTKVRSLYNGIQVEYHFDNGYGASVVQHDGSYGGKSQAHVYELAVLKVNDLCYDTPITNDVLGWLNTADVLAVLHSIEALPHV